MNKKEILFGILCGLALPAVGLFAIFGAVKCFATVEKYVYPVLFVWFVALFFPGLVTACFRKTRGWTAAVMVWWSYAFGAYLWLNALSVTVAICGWVWAIVGIILGGVGIFPVVLVALALHGLWGDFGVFVGNIVTFFIVRLFGIWLATKSPGWRD